MWPAPQIVGPYHYGLTAGETILNTMVDHLSYVSCRGSLKKLWNKDTYLDVDALRLVTF